MMTYQKSWIPVMSGFRTRTGIQERRISLTENTSDLAIHVAQQLLEKSGSIS